MATTTIDTLLVKIQADTKQLERELTKVKRTTEQTTSKMASSFKKFDASLGRAIKRTALVGGAIGGAFGAVAIKKIIDVGSEVENLQVRFRSMFGSIEEGNQAFDNMAKFAARVPFSLEEIQRGSGSLAAVAKGAEHLSSLLQITGNAAALSGLGFAEASMQIQRAFSAGINSAEIFKERGLAGMLGFEKGATVSVEETVRVFEEAFTGDGKFAKMTDELAQTLTGTLSMIGDKIFSFQRLIADEKFFGTVKKQFEDLNSFLDTNKKSVDELAESIGIGLAQGIEASVKGLIFINENLEEFKTILKAIGGLVAFKLIKDLIVGLGKLGKSAGLLALLKIMPPQLKIAVGGAVALGLALEGVKKAMGNTNAEGKELVNTLNKINEEIQTGGVADFMNTKSPKSPVEPQAAPNRGLDGEKSKLEETFETQKKNLTDQIQLLKIRNDDEREFQEILQKTGIVQTDMVEQLRELFDETKQLEKANEESEQAIEDRNDRLEDAKRIIEGVKTEEDKLKETILQLKEAMGEFNEEELPQAEEALKRLEQELQSLNPVVKILEDNFERAFDGIASAIADSMTEGKDAMESFRDVARNILNSLIRDFVNFQMKAILKRPLGDEEGFGIGKILGGLGSLFGGSSGQAIDYTSYPGGFAFGKAGGGAVAPNVPTVVGERGAELFVPNTSGRIVNNANMKGMGGGTTVINQNLNVETGVAQTVRAEMLNILPLFKQETLAAVAESRLRGGEFASAFTGGK